MQEPYKGVSFAQEDQREEPGRGCVRAHVVLTRVAVSRHAQYLSRQRTGRQCLSLVTMQNTLRKL